MNTLVGFILAAILSNVVAYKVLYAVDEGNSGQRTDSNGLVYQADPNGCPYSIGVSGAKPVDLVIYNTFCYGIDSFAHEISLGGGLKNGTYLLVLRLFENIPQRRTSIVLNNKHTLADRVSFFEQAGNGTAYDEHVYFTVCGDRLLYRNEESRIVGNTLKVEFIANRNYYFGVVSSAIVLVVGDDVDKFPRLAANGDSKDTIISRLYQKYEHQRCGTAQNGNGTGNGIGSGELVGNGGITIVNNGTIIVQNCNKIKTL